jgi:hypothetical protein
VVQRDGIHMFGVSYWSDALTPFHGLRHDYNPDT